VSSLPTCEWNEKKEKEKTIYVGAYMWMCSLDFYFLLNGNITFYEAAEFVAACLAA